MGREALAVSESVSPEASIEGKGRERSVSLNHPRGGGVLQEDGKSEGGGPRPKGQGVWWDESQGQSSMWQTASDTSDISLGLNKDNRNTG